MFFSYFCKYETKTLILFMKHFIFGKAWTMVACMALMMAGCSGGQQPSQEGMNRKPGNYPGNPEEWFAPQLVLWY